jgi:hypothetical protein
MNSIAMSTQLADRELALVDFELFSFPGGRYDDQIDSISQALAYEISGGEWMTDAAIKGYTELTEALCFDRLFSGA